MATLDMEPGAFRRRAPPVLVKRLVRSLGYKKRGAGFSRRPYSPKGKVVSGSTDQNLLLSHRLSRCRLLRP